MVGKRYSLYLLLLVIATISVVMIYISVHFSTLKHQNDLLALSVNHKIVLARNINEALILPIWQEPGLLTDYLKRVAQIEGVTYIRILGPDDKVLLSSLDGEEGKIIKTEIPTTREPIVKEDFFQDKTIQLIIYPGYENRTIAVALSAIPARVQVFTKDLLMIDIIVALLATAATLGVIFLFFRILLQPLKKLVFAFEKVQQGNLDVQIDVKSKTEIGQLTNAFNRMTAILSDYQKSIHKEHSTLQERVDTRTEELRKLTQDLEMQVQNKSKELREKIRELEGFHKIAVKRELRMVRLKKVLSQLRKRIKA